MSLACVALRAQFPAGVPLLAENIPAAGGTPGSTVLEPGAPDACAHLHPQRQSFRLKLGGGYGVGPALSSQAVTDSQGLSHVKG